MSDATDAMYNAWTYLEPTDSTEIDRLRRAVREVGPDRFKPETDPHISLLPGVEFETEAARDAFLADVDEGETFTVQVTGLSPFPAWDGTDESGDATDFDGPITFTLDVAEDGAISDLRDRHADVRDRNDGTEKYPPVPAHLTLTKVGDFHEDVEELAGAEADHVRAELPDVEPFVVEVAVRVDPF